MLLITPKPHDQQLHFAFQEFDPNINTATDFHGQKLSNLDITSQLDNHLSELRQEFNNSPSIKLDVSDACEDYADFTTPQSVHVPPPPPSAFLGPKCALWDCTRPAHGSDCYLDYCSDYHGNLALEEDSTGTAHGLFEWHLFEYQINESDVCALYRLELKLTNGKKSPKGRVAKDPLADLQKKMEKMGQLTPEGDFRQTLSSYQRAYKVYKRAYKVYQLGI